MDKPVRLGCLAEVSRMNPRIPGIFGRMTNSTRAAYVGPGSVIATSTSVSETSRAYIPIRPSMDTRARTATPSLVTLQSGASSPGQTCPSSRRLGITKSHPRKRKVNHIKLRGQENENPYLHRHYIVCVARRLHVKAGTMVRRPRWQASLRNVYCRSSGFGE